MSNYDIAGLVMIWGGTLCLLTVSVRKFDSLGTIFHRIICIDKLLTWLLIECILYKIDITK